MFALAWPTRDNQLTQDQNKVLRHFVDLQTPIPKISSWCRKSCKKEELSHLKVKEFIKGSTEQRQFPWTNPHRTVLRMSFHFAITEKIHISFDNLFQINLNIVQPKIVDDCYAMQSGLIASPMFNCRLNRHDFKTTVLCSSLSNHKQTQSDISCRLMQGSSHLIG